MHADLQELFQGHQRIAPPIQQGLPIFVQVEVRLCKVTARPDERVGKIELAPLLSRAATKHMNWYLGGATSMRDRRYACVHASSEATYVFADAMQVDTMMRNLRRWGLVPAVLAGALHPGHRARCPKTTLKAQERQAVFWINSCGGFCHDPERTS